MKKITTLLLALFLLSSCTTPINVNEATTTQPVFMSTENIVTGYTEVIPLIYDDARPFSDGLAAICIDDKWGFIDKNGKEVIPCKYEWVDSFVDGICLVGVRENSVKVNRFGYIDKTGREIYPFINEYVFSPPPGDRCLKNLICDGMLKIYTDGKWGFADYSGTEIIPPLYDKALSFSDGMAAVYTMGKWSYIDKTGEVVLTVNYDNVESFYEGLAAVCVNDKWGYIDKNGTEIIPCIYEYADKFENDIAGVSKNGEATYSDGFINKSGEFIFEPQYNLMVTFDNQYFARFSEGLVAVENADGKFGFIDTKGRLTIDFLYDSVSAFSEGMAGVRKGGLEDGAWGFVDKNGEEIIPCVYSHINSFQEGVTAFSLGGNINSKYILLNKNGERIVPPIYSYISDVSEGMAVVQSEYEGKMGFIKLL